MKRHSVGGWWSPNFALGLLAVFVGGAVGLGVSQAPAQRFPTAAVPDHTSIVVVQGPGWQQTVTAITTGIAALGFLAALFGVLWARRQVQEASRSRHAEIAIDMSRRWDEDTMVIPRRALKGMSPWEVRKFLNTLVDGTDEEVAQYYALQKIGNYFEDLAALWKNNCLSLEWVDDTLGGAVIQFWRKWRPFVDQERQEQPTLYENWESLERALRIHRATRASSPSGAP